MTQPATTPERQRIERYKHDVLFARELDARYLHQQQQNENEMSGGRHANETDIIEALNSTSTGDSKFNSLWVVPITILVFVAVILLTNSCLGL